MAEYSARCSELDRELEQLQNKALEEERRGGAPAVLSVYVRIKEGLAKYYDWRDRALNECVSCVKADPSATAQSQQERWANYHLQKASEAAKSFDNFVTSSDPDVIKRTFERIALVEEPLFFQSLAQMPMARFQGQVRERVRELEGLRGELEEKWRNLIGLDERQDYQIAVLRLEILDMLRKRVEEARGWAPKIENILLTALGPALLGALKEATHSYDPASRQPLSDAVEAFKQQIKLLQPTLDTLAQRGLSLYGNKQPVHEIFGKNREYLGEYLNQVNKETIARQYSEAERETREKAEYRMTDGQKQDAKRLAETLIRESRDLVGEFNTTIDKFKDQFDGRFVGEVSDKTVELLTEQAFFNEFWKQVQSVNLPGEFRQVSDQITRLEDFSLDDLDEEQRRRLKELIRTELAPLEEELRRIDPDFIERLLSAPFVTAISTFVAKLKNLPGSRGR